MTDNEVRGNGYNLSANLSAVDNDGAWLSYPELARLRGINLTSAFRLARRHGWRRQKGNDGKLRVLVPAADRTIDLDKSDDRGRREPDKGQDNDLALVVAALRSDTMEVIRPLQDAIAVLEAQLTEANSRTDRADQALAGERARADVLREQLDAAHTALVTAQGEATDAVARAEAAQIGQAEAEADTAELRRELAVAQHDAKAAQQSAEVMRQADEARKARGRWSRLRAAWRGD